MPSAEIFVGRSPVRTITMPIVETASKSFRSLRLTSLGGSYTSRAVGSDIDKFRRLRRSRSNYSAIKCRIIRCIKLAFAGRGRKITEHAEQGIQTRPPLAIQKLLDHKSGPASETSKWSCARLLLTVMVNNPELREQVIVSDIASDPM